MTYYPPPKLDHLGPTLSVLPPSELPWIAEKHVLYLDDRIHKIGQLTEYLATCNYVARERHEFVEFVDRNTRESEAGLDVYVAEYAHRFSSVREAVEEQCNQILTGDTGDTRSERVQFWEQFALINEIDSLHGMFLTSGRWYVNVMLPVFKELALCTLPDSIPVSRRVSTAYDIARRVITPQFADPGPDFSVALERAFTKRLIPLLQFYDRKLLFLFDTLASVPFEAHRTLGDFVQIVSTEPQNFASLLNMGVYPPFAWHELHASRRPRRQAITYDSAILPLMEAIAPGYEERFAQALRFLEMFKEYELNYNNYNYKGRFGLVSKHFYLQTTQRLSQSNQDAFLDAILGDRFFEALAVVQSDTHF